MTNKKSAKPIKKNSNDSTLSNQLLQQVRSVIERYQMIRKNDRILVGVSGGPDSVCLLSVLTQLKDDYHIKLYAFHLNHQLRGKESEADARFVKELCRQFKVTCRIRKFAVSEYAEKHKLSLEQAAREVRYQLLEQERRRFGCSKIALGHNANDNVETVILNLLRGSGLAGLCGIPPVRDYIIRPLIETKREEILKYLTENQIFYQLDSTNLDTKIPRNFIRIKIIPALKKLNPNLIETVTKVATILRDEECYLNNLAEKIVKKVVIERSKHSLTLDKTRLLSYNLAIQRRIWKSLLPDLGYDKIELIRKMSEMKTVGTIQLGPKLIANLEYDRIHLGPPTMPARNRQILVPVGNSLEIEDMGLVIETNLKNNADLERAKKDSNLEIFDYEKLTLPLYLRYRQPGDRFVFAPAKTK
ncbi:MAG: tRNA lysidine(34) synthetase TilS, partial [candidate division WOR-3 bacterium]